MRSWSVARSSRRRSARIVSAEAWVDQDQRPAAHQRFGEGGETGRGSRVHLRQEAAAVGETVPAAADLHSSPWVAPATARGVLGAAGPRDVRVGLRPDLDAEVVHAGGQRFGEAHRERQQRQASTGRSVRRRRPSASRPSGPGDHGVGLARPSTTSSPLLQAAPRNNRHRASARAGRPAAVSPCSSAELVGEQDDGLGHPVGVRGDRQLGALAVRVVVAGDAAVGPGRSAAARRAPRGTSWLAPSRQTTVAGRPSA